MVGSGDLRMVTTWSGVSAGELLGRGAVQSATTQQVPCGGGVERSWNRTV